MNFVEDLFEVNKAWQIEETLTGCLLSMGKGQCSFD